MDQYAIIVAAGNGSRFGAQLPKQFEELNGMPMLWYSMRAFQKFNTHISLILCLPEHFIDKWNIICEEKKIDIEHHVVTGGSTRSETVNKALQTLPDEGLVFIHDAARPCLKVDLIESLFTGVEMNHFIMPVVSVQESMGEIENDEFVRSDRKRFVSIQTPQVFNLAKYKNAYLEHYDENASDESEIMIKAGINITTIEGDESNIKVTFPHQMAAAESILNEYEA